MHASSSCDQYMNTTTEEASEEESCQSSYKYSFYPKASTSTIKKKSSREYEVQKKNFAGDNAPKISSTITSAKTTHSKKGLFSKAVAASSGKANTFMSTSLNPTNILSDTLIGNGNTELCHLKSQVDDVFSFIKQWKEDITGHFRDMSLTLDRLEELIQKDSNHSQELPSEDDSIKILPINSSKELKKFDRDLNDVDYKRKIYSHLSLIIGSGPMSSKAACYKLSNSIFTKELLTHYSWTGMSRSHSKESFQKLKNVLDVFYKLVYKVDNTFSYVQRDAFFRDCFLKHSHTRLSQPWKKKKQHEGQLIEEQNDRDEDFDENENEEYHTEEENSSNGCDDLRKIKDWCSANKLCFNIDKTNIVGFKCDMQNTYLGDDLLQDKTVTKFLGVHIDTQLRFEDHILKLSKRLSSGCFAIRCVRAELGETIARSVYFALFESHLRYGIPFWGAASQHLLKMLFILQKKAIRFIRNIKQKESCKPHFVKQKILTLTSLYILESASLVYKNSSSISESGLQRVSRRQYNLPLPIPKSTLTQKSLIYESRKIFNHLPSSIKLVPSLRQFRKKLKKLLLTRPYYSMSEFHEEHFE